MNDHTSGWQPAKTHDHHLVTASSSDDEIDLGELFALFWRRKFTLIIAMLLAVILGAAYVSTQPNLYEAEATLILDEQEQNATGLEALAPGLSNEDAEMNSQIQVIKSRKLMGIVVDDQACLSYLTQLTDGRIEPNEFQNLWGNITGGRSNDTAHATPPPSDRP